jgi:hypothetical protein
MSKKSDHLPNLSSLGLVQEASFADPFTHGLDPEDQSFQARLDASNHSPTHHMGICDMVWLNPQAMGSDDEAFNHELLTAKRALHERMISWAEYIEYQELGAPLLLLSTPTPTSEGGGSGAAKRAERTHVRNPQQIGMLDISRVFATTLEAELSKRQADTGKAESHTVSQASHEAQALVKQALKELMPANAMLFVSPDELVAVHREAEKIAREAFAKAVQSSSVKGGDAAKSPLLTVKTMLEGRIRGLKQRHDARFYNVTGPAEFSPTTGIATLISIATQQQSRGNDAGSGLTPPR